MPTCRDIVTLGLRLRGVVGSNSLPTAAESERGMELLQGLYEHWATSGMFGRLTDTVMGTAGAAREGQRIRATDGAAITLPTSIADRGPPRAPYDLALVEIYDVDAETGSVNLWDRNSWVRLDGLTLSSEAPLATRGRDGLAACLGEAYVEMFGGSLTPGVAARARKFRANIMSKRGSTQDRSGDDSDYY